MALREKILVSLMACAVAWVVVTSVKGGSGQGSSATKSKAASEADQASNDVQRLQASLIDVSIVSYLERAGAPMATNPFFADPVVVATNLTVSTPKFIYSGHIKAGSREIAIIDGQEYFEGELLSTGAYVVEKVLDDRVLLRGREKGETNEVLLIETTNK